MVARSNKVFRAEAANRNGAEVAAVRNDFLSDNRHKEIMKALKQLREDFAPSERVTERVVDDYKLQMEEARKLKAELDEIYEAISRTKHEIATLHHSGFQGEEVGRVTNELDAVIEGTEKATEGILSAAEIIDNLAGDLHGKYADTESGPMICDIQEQTIKIFENCNFQDLTGQRITKVVNVLRFIEDRIDRMMEIWGGMEVFNEIEGDILMPKREGDAALLNGPSLETDADTASQDDIDALFG